MGSLFIGFPSESSRPVLLTVLSAFGSSSHDLNQQHRPDHEKPDVEVAEKRAPSHALVDRPPQEDRCQGERQRPEVGASLGVGTGKVWQANMAGEMRMQ